jgi:hypothetical protein
MALAVGGEMMRMILGFAAVSLALSGCSNQYFERKDTVTFSAGDAVAWNKAQQIVDPAPRSAYNTNIVTPGVTAERAGADYAQGRYRWYTTSGSSDTPKEIMVDPYGSDKDRAAKVSASAAFGREAAGGASGSDIAAPASGGATGAPQ